MHFIHMGMTYRTGEDRETREGKRECSNENVGEREEETERGRETERSGKSNINWEIVSLANADWPNKMQ